MTNIELLKLAAQAIGKEYPFIVGDGGRVWNPIEDDGDALRLAVSMELSIVVGIGTIHAWKNPYENTLKITPFDDIKDSNSAVRRAIVRSAAQFQLDVMQGETLRRKYNLLGETK